MAIHPSFPQMPVTIVVNGHSLHEHEDREATPDHEGPQRNHVLRYIEIPSTNIESPSGSDLGNEDDTVPFQIDADAHGLQPDSYAGYERPASERGDYGIAFHIAVDGEDVDSLLIDPAMIESHYANGTTCISKGQYITADSVLPYHFKVIKLIDATTAAARGVRSDAEKEKLEQLGKVRICVYHVRKQGLVVPTPDGDFQDRSIHGLDEVDLKGKSLSHSVGFGDAIPDRGAAAVSEVEPVDLENGPDAVYEFRYGSRVKQEIMEAEGGPINRGPIIPNLAKTILCIDDDDQGFTEKPLPELLTKRPRIQPTTIDDDEVEYMQVTEHQSLFVPEDRPSVVPTEHGAYDFFGEFQNRFGHNLGAS
ncbi:hypothetical protein CERZMDRAFT_86121 [Cercospora zeae-maydis SCOH1-5]|uniref:DUF7918 domain-containing protein n=1 Tax=Cercospora zeae-maydis SCOH1-5 TaxID=717836 RepID=A0A6A6FAG6_9PEZI|nr:hypothetical protein CERZMDRAFT_86121 [Cercospora zeae-maydis SCOH1-5]